MYPAQSTRDTCIKLSKGISSMLLLCFSLSLVISSLLFFSGVPLSPLTLPISIIISLGYFILASRLVLNLEMRQIFFGLLLIFILALIMSLVSSSLYDFSYDGRYYHQKAITKLMQGWNPVLTEIEAGNDDSHVYINHYPAGIWILSALINKGLNNQESGKSVHIFMMFIVFLAALSYFLSFPQIKTWEAGAISIALAANPVSVYQSLSYYVDGILSSMIILLLLLLLQAIKHNDALTRVAILCTIILGYNIKFTGVVYLTTIILIMSLVIWFQRKTIYKPHLLLATLLMSVIMAVFVVGFHPYLTNTIHYGHPFYPLVGSDQFNTDHIISRQMPTEFQEKSWYSKLLISIFSPSQNSREQVPESFKAPFSISLSEIKIHSTPDTRIGGWGPLFGALIILSVITLIIISISEKHIALVGLGFIGIVFATILPIREAAWWARYFPQLWLIPVVTIVVALLSREKLSRYFGEFLLVIALINIFLVLGAYYGWNLRETVKLEKTLNRISREEQPVQVYYGPFESTEHILKEHNINYSFVQNLEDMPCPTLLAPEVYYAPAHCQQ